jgi:hypothetical protein
MARTPNPRVPQPQPGPLCGTCGQPKKNHSAEQLADCMAQQN